MTGLPSLAAMDVPALTGLRGAAAVWVIGYHIGIWLPGHPLPDAVFRYGFLGVDIFFVLSGYLLTSLHIGMRRSGWATFFTRRIFRIYPLHLFVMACLALLVAGLGVAQVRLGPYYSWSSFPSVLALVQVFTGRSGWNDPTWSIGSEIASYLLLPPALFAIRAVPRGAGLAMFVALISLDAALIARTTATDDGALITPITGLVPVARGLLGFFAGAMLSRAVPMRTLGSGPFHIAFSWQPLFWLGEVSYSLYLLHAPVLSATKRTMPLLERHGIAWAAVPLAVSAIVLLSAATYRWIEQSGLRLGRRFGRACARPAAQATVSPPPRG